ncbi:Nucleolar pre-ribosomal-associated protein 1 [Fragilaria crotonensis]|nr:Nucleolar pre-ribosomal-associated protein 1 [Fragilaria crotonensis]
MYLTNFPKPFASVHLLVSDPRWHGWRIRHDPAHDIISLKLTQHQAHGTSLFAVAATGVAGALGYSGQVDVEAAVAISVSGMIMARAGAGMTATMSERSLKRALGVFMLLIAHWWCQGVLYASTR